MVYRQTLLRYERSDPQGYNNWESHNSTPNNQATPRRVYQTPPSNRTPLPSSSGRQGVIYNSFLSTDEQPDKSRLDPPPSLERIKKVVFSKQLEVHEKEKTPINAAPATPILRSGARTRRNLAQMPLGRESPQKFSGRDPTPRAGNIPIISVQPEKRKTIYDIMSERTNTAYLESMPRVYPASDRPLNRSRRQHISASIQSPRDIFSKMALRATQSEIKPPKDMEPEAAQALLRQARLSHEEGKSSDKGWDISELFPSTPQSVKTQSNTHRTPSNIQELLSRPSPPPPLSDPQKLASHLKAFESRNDHCDSPDPYNDSWNRYRQDTSPSNSSTESPDACLMSRCQPKSNECTSSSLNAGVSDIRHYRLQQGPVQTPPQDSTNVTKKKGSKNVIVKANQRYAHLEQTYGKEENGTEVLLTHSSNSANNKVRGGRVNAAESGKRLDFGALLKCGAPQASTVALQQFPSSGISFEESPDLHKNATDDTSESGSVENVNAKRNIWQNLDDESTESPQNYEDNVKLLHSQQRFKRKGTFLWVVLFVFAAGLALGLPIYYFVFAGTESSDLKQTTSAPKFDACVEGPPDPALYSSRYTSIRKMVLGTLDGEAWRVDEPGSPQRKALCWISDFDTQISSISGADIPAIIQRYTMGVLYYALVIDDDTSEGSLSHSDYLSSSHECEWSVVICASRMTVTSLLLADKLLTGPLPAEIANLVNLSFLDLSRNNLSGNIPTSIEKLTLLEYLALAFNSFSGSIPSEIGLLTRLQLLNMRTSQVHGKIPTELGGLSNLETLLLEGNWLSGLIPVHLGNLGQAQQMSFRENYLTGRVPGELCELRDMLLADLQVDSWIECDCCTI